MFEILMFEILWFSDKLRPKETLNCHRENIMNSLKLWDELF